jgi:hypothetical protein
VRVLRAARRVAPAPAARTACCLACPTGSRTSRLCLATRRRGACGACATGPSMRCACSRQLRARSVHPCACRRVSPYTHQHRGSVTRTPTTHTRTQPSWAYSALSGAAGALLLAKTATGELAWGDTWFGNITTRNPWNAGTGSCGSSAGSATAVAAGGVGEGGGGVPPADRALPCPDTPNTSTMHACATPPPALRLHSLAHTGLLPFGIGSETWGSIVCPATTVGVTAFRPSGGTIPGNGMLQARCSLLATLLRC